jgi:hypothetical protein
MLTLKTFNATTNTTARGTNRNSNFTSYTSGKQFLLNATNNKNNTTAFINAVKNTPHVFCVATHKNKTWAVITLWAKNTGYNYVAVNTTTIACMQFNSIGAAKKFIAAAKNSGNKYSLPLKNAAVYTGHIKPLAA